MGENGFTIDQPEKTYKPVRSDVDGTDLIVRNILVSWGGYAFQILSGFILPRMIDNRLGQQELGVWDFAWSLVSYFGLVQVGMVSSITRYVALYRARGEMHNINRTVSSVACVLCMMGALIVLMAIASSWGVSYVLAEQLVGLRTEAQWLILLLGISIAVQVTSSTFGGVLTGLHRWDLHNIIDAGTYIVTLVGSVIVLLLGQGLVGLAAVYLGSHTIGRLVRGAIAYQVCPGLKIHWQYVYWDTVRTMLGFGTKTLVPQIGQLLLNQTVNIMIVAHLGPAALALYARPRALVMHVFSFLQKYAHVFVPTASSLHSRGNLDDVRKLVIQAVRYGSYISLPMILVLALSGDNLMYIWMGSNYSNALLIIFLVLGHLTYITYMPLLRVLAGLNMHGRPGIANLLAACTALFFVHVVLKHLEAGLPGVALAVGFPLTVVNGIYLPLYACRRLDIAFGRFLMQVWYGPLVSSIPFALCLIAGRWLYNDSPGMALLWGGGVGGAVLSICYWKYVVPKTWKKKLFFNPK